MSRNRYKKWNINWKLWWFRLKIEIMNKIAKELQKKIAATYELDKLLTKLRNKNGITKY